MKRLLWVGLSVCWLAGCAEPAVGHHIPEWVGDTGGFGAHGTIAESYRAVADKIGTLKSFTFDNFAGSPNPPLVATVVDIEGGRLYLQMTDVSPKEVKLDLPVELTFRKMHDAGGTPNYYWKCTPVR